MRKIISSITVLYLALMFPRASFAIEAGQDSLPPIILEFKDPFIPLLPKKDIVETPGAPTAAVSTEATVLVPELHISGLIWNSARPQAIINNQVVGIGDVVNEATIVGIQKSGIDIVYRGEYFSIDPNAETAKVKSDTRSP